MSNVTHDTVYDIVKQKEVIMDALEELSNLIRSTGDHQAIGQFDSYVKGGVEQAMVDFGMHNTCIESIVKDLEEQLEGDEPECEECEFPRSECNC